MNNDKYASRAKSSRLDRRWKVWSLNTRFSWSLPPHIEDTVESHHGHIALCQWQMCREMEILLRQPLSRRHCLHHCNQALHSGKAHQCKAHQRIISQLPIVATKTRRSNIMHQPKAGCTASLVYLGTFGHDRSIYFQLQATKFAPKQTQALETKRTNFHSIVQRKLDKTGIWNVHVVIWRYFKLNLKSLLQVRLKHL